MNDISLSTPLAALDAVALDTETTGLDVKSARIIQIGAVRLLGATILSEQRLDCLINPGIPIPAVTTDIHGITDAAVRSAPAFSVAADELEAFLGNAIIIGHTIDYDLRLLDRESKLAGRSFKSRRFLDVRLLAEIARPNLGHYDLDFVAATLGVRIEGRHSAIGDAVATARIFAALVPRLRERNIRTLAEAEAASRALAERQIAAAQRPVRLAPAPTELQSALIRIDSFTYTHRVKDVMSTPPEWCAPSTTVRDVIRLMMERRISSVLVKDPDGEAGIATERDMLRALDRQTAAGLDAPVVHFISKPLQTIGQDEYLYRAIGRMDRLGVRHLAVTGPTGAITGMVTTRNLLRHRASSALVLGDAIDRAETEPALGQAWAALPLMARSLLVEDVAPRDVAAVISAELCALTRRAAELAEVRMVEAGQGPPPARYALLVLGSAGRGESLLAADQDNALVFEDGEPGGATDHWFEQFATHVAEILDEVGVPFCKGGVMAKTALWRHSLAGWHAVIDGWVRRQRPEDILNVDIFFDGVAVYGETALADAVFKHAFDTAHRSVTFQKQLTETVRIWHAPVSVFGNLKTDAQGRIDLKKFGLLPIFTAARALAIKHDMRMRATPQRLRAIIAPNKANDSEVEALIAAHGAIMGAMLAQQLRDGERGVPLSPRVELKGLSPGQRTALTAAVRKVATAIDLVSEGRL